MNQALYLSVGKAGLIAEPQPDAIYAATLYPAIPGFKVDDLPSAAPEVLNAIPHLRIDTVNGCNLDCVFCHTDFSARVRHLEVADLAFALSPGRFTGLQGITLGCAFEPLLGKHFEEFPSALGHLSGRLNTEVVTNGILLNRRDLAPWVEFGLKRLYVSVYSHIPAVYESTGRGAAKFDQIEANLLATRKRFPRLEIYLVNPICKANDVDVAAFCRWAFEHVGADAIDLRRAFFVEKPAPGYPAFTYLGVATKALGRSPALTDQEWLGILQSCSEYSTDPRTISLAQKIHYPSVLLRPRLAKQALAS